MMKNNKILISPKNLEDVEKYKKIGISNFLFTTSGFGIGYTEYELETLKKLDINIYLNINILCDTKKINELKEIKDDLSFVKGIFFEDLGVYNLLKDSGIPLIWNQAHYVINSRSINFWLERCSSACLSNELTKEEINFILKESTKELVLPVYGNNMAMYSRRHLLTNFNTFKGYDNIDYANLGANDKSGFYALENDNGTAVFYDTLFNYYPYINEFDDSKVLYYYFDNSNTEFEDYLKVVNNEEIVSDERFLNNKTIYKLEGR